MQLTSEEELRNLYGWAKGRAQKKVLSELERHSINFIRKSPFLVISTRGRDGSLDASPRGGEPGFVEILDNRTILIPDTKGNNRVDSLVNIVETGSLGCLFLIPGIDETLRMNGEAVITTDVDHLALFASMNKKPKTCIKLTIDEVFLHCAKALMRSKLWGDEFRIDRPGFPTMGRMLKDQLNDKEKVETQEEMLHRYQGDL